MQKLRSIIYHNLLAVTCLFTQKAIFTVAFPFFALRFHFGPSLTRRMASLSQDSQSDFLTIILKGIPFLSTSNESSTSPWMPDGLLLYSSGDLRLLAR